MRTRSKDALFIIMPPLVPKIVLIDVHKWDALVHEAACYDR